MSRFVRKDVGCIQPYIPGEQPRDRRYIKLNTNENPYFISEKAVARIGEEALRRLNRYSDPSCSELHRAIADFYGLNEGNVLATNGSDEALAFAFYAYCRDGVCYPDVTYGFYDVVAHLFGCPVEHIPLNEKFEIEPESYFDKGKTVVIANPNAQTGIGLDIDALRSVLDRNRENVVVVDQAYADFAEEKDNVIPLVKEYDNLLVVNTFSKSRSLAGARVGFIVADVGLIGDVAKVKNSFHPYNVNSLSSALAAAAIADKEYFYESVRKVKESREKLNRGLMAQGFEVLPSSSNFVLAKSPKYDGKELYERLKAKGVLVRYLTDERLREYVRITVGTDDEMKELLRIIKELHDEKG